MAKKCPECKEGAPEWMATFSDMMTLLMCFFVMLISMSSFEINKYRDVVMSLKGAMGVMVSPNNVMVRREVQFARVGGRKQYLKRAASMAKKITATIKEYKLSSAVQVDLLKNGLAIRITDPVLFDPGSAKLKESAKPFLKRIAMLLVEAEGTPIRVEGHTDNTPIRTEKYPSNWELAAARACSVVRFFASVGVNPYRMSAVSYGEYKPLVPNNSPQNRAKNRRIEIFIEYITEEKLSE